MYDVPECSCCFGRYLPSGCFTEYSVFRASCFQISVHFTLIVFFCGSPKIILKLSSNSEGVAKKLGNLFFVVVSCPCSFSISSHHGHLSSSYSRDVCKCVIHPCFLTFVVVMFSFFAVVVFPYFYSSLSLLCSLLLIQLFVFAVFSLGGTETQMKPQNISQFRFSCSASGPASPNFHLAQIITLLSPEKNLSKWCYFALFLALLTMC